MSSKTRVRTYGRQKKIESNYIPKPISPFKITEASTVIDALFSKNIRKRNLSPNNKNVIKKKTRGRPRKPERSELTSPVYPTMLNNDSLKIKINSTFDNLLQGPVYNQVNICNKSSLYVSNSTDTSNSKIISEKKQSSYNIRNRKKKNYALYLDGSYNTWEKSCNKSVLPNGKIRKKRNNPRKLKQIINNVVINISDTITDKQNIPKKIHSYLDKSINCSLIIERQSKQKTVSNENSFSCAKKFTPIASTSKLLSVKNCKQDNIFRHGFRHLMRAESTPRYIHSSTPILSRNIKIDDKLSVSPITVSAKSRLNFTSNNSKSLCESKKVDDISSIHTANNTVNTNNDSIVISINSTIPEIANNIKNVAEKVIIDDTINSNNSLIPSLEMQLQSVNADNDKISNNIDLKTNSFIANDSKLNGKAIVLLDRHLDILGINGDTSVICRFPNLKTNFKNESIPVVHLEKQLDVLGISEDTNVICRFSNSQTDKGNERVPVVYLERLSVSKYFKEHGLGVTISSRSQSIIDEPSSLDISDVRRNSSKRNSSLSIFNEQSNSKTYKIIKKSITNKNNTRSFSNNTKKYNSKISSDEWLSNIKNFKSNVSTNLRSPGNIKLPINSSNRNTDSRNSSKSSIIYTDFQQNCSNRILESQHTVNLKKGNEHSDIMENTAKSMFVSRSSDIIENSMNDDASISKNFVTTRKRRIQINTESNTNDYKSIESTKPHNIDYKLWEKISQSKINLVRIEDCKELKNYSEVSRRKTHINIDINPNRNGIFLKSGKKWYRSLSILRQTNLHEIEEDKYCNKGRKWRDSVYEVLEKQTNGIGAFHEIGDGNFVNDMKHKIRPSKQTALGIRKSLKIVNISVKESSILAEEIHENKSGYVPSLAHVSILESFDKLSLSTNVDDREETARQIILKRCGQTDPIPFDDCYSSRTLKKCRKIGEGVYGEVFMYKSLDNKCRVMKVIPIEGNLVVNGEHQKKFEEIISEIIIASELSNLRINNEFCTNGYAELLQIACVQGKYPQHLLDLWDLFDEERGSENDSPEIFTEDQLYIVLELANGGQDLEAFRFSNAEQSYALFVQVVCSLAVAESAMQFEHRDMHWGNILIAPTDDTTTTFRLKGREFEVATRGVKVSVIDFTLSRMTYNNCCIYNDLALDPDLFTATGDYQFDIYRLMKQRNQNDWQAFEPYTNILWLDYTLEKMISHVRYLRVTTKTHKSYIRRLSQIRKKILNYNSATELLNSDVFSNVFL